MINITPGWYGGELANVIVNEIETDTGLNDLLVNELGFLYEDFDTNQEYGSIDKIIRTYGLIFGVKAIDYLRKNQKRPEIWNFWDVWLYQNPSSIIRLYIPTQGVPSL